MQTAKVLHGTTRDATHTNGTQPKGSLQKTKQGFLSLLAKASPSNWEHVTVNKNVDSVTMPKWVASAILVAVLGFGVSSWWRQADQRDMIIEMRTELRLAKEAEIEARATQRGFNGDMQAWREVTNGNLKELKGMIGMLTPSPSAVDRVRAKGN